MIGQPGRGEDQMSADKPAYDFRIDAIRGIACILLVAFHVIGEKPEFGLRLEYDHPFALFAEIFIHLRMPLFAMLSGFVYAYRPASGARIGDYFKGKARRLVLPFLFAATLFAGVNTVLGGAYAVPLADFWQVYVISYSQFWFIQSVLILFIVVGLMDAVFGAEKAWPILALIGLAGLLFLTRVAEGVEVFSLGKAIYLAPFFLTGIALNRLGDRIPVIAGYVIAGLTLLGLAAHAADTLMEPGMTTDRRTWIALFLALGLSSSLVIYRFRARPLELIGRYSYTIYLYHLFAVFGLQFVYDRLGMPPSPVGLALGVAFSLALPMIAHEMARYTGRWVPLIPMITLGLKADAKTPTPGEFQKAV
jgi:fucose 4-O-acetylase-like acetyltransferase